MACVLKRKVLCSELILARISAGGTGFLDRSGLEAHVIGTLDALLASIAAGPPDMVALDGASPDLPVLPACRRILADERTRSIPILAVAADATQAELLQQAGCTDVLPREVDSIDLQERIVRALGMRLRRHDRFPVVLPVARGRIFHEFLGFSNTLSEGGMGFETSIHLRGGEHLPLRLYRSTGEDPIHVLGRVCAVRPLIDGGIGYFIGVEFSRLEMEDRRRLLELFPPPEPRPARIPESRH